MNRSQQFFTKYRFPLFFLLSYLLSWWLLPATRQGMLPHGVAFAAMIVLALTAGRAGLGEWWGRVTNFRGGWWYLIGPGILVGALVVAFALNLLLGATVTGGLQFPLEVVFIFLIVGGMWEEPGWTGYALPALQQRYAKAANGPLMATLVLGIFRAIWHLPLVIVGAIPWYEGILLNVLVFQPIISWLYNKSRGSVPVVMVFHFMSNFLSVIVGRVFAGAEATQYRILFFILGFVAAVVIAWRTRLTFGWRGEES
ncbi:MAG TPA: CPBP family intramembrane glutamic endopeptidase [Anaerolineales bacterium]|nr:CPBP family intramembrane glutamic endopeptidase [Anaerolineales bacterium]